MATFTRTGGITSLGHESLDIPMKDAAVVIVGSTKGEKVLQHKASCKGLKLMRIRTAPIYLRGFRHSFTEHFDFEVTEGGVESDRLFASRVGEFGRAEKKRKIKITIALRVSGSDGGGGRGKENDQSIRRIRVPT